MIAITMMPGARASAALPAESPVLAATAGAPAAANTSRNVPHISAKSRRHSRAALRKSGAIDFPTIRRCSAVTGTDPRCASASTGLPDFSPDVTDRGSITLQFDRLVSLRHQHVRAADLRGKSLHGILLAVHEDCQTGVGLAVPGKEFGLV